MEVFRVFGWIELTFPLLFYLLGIMGGENYAHPGGGVNYLCLPKTPKYDKYKDGQQVAGHVYGAEYELPFNPFKKSLNQHDPPCVVCFVKSRGSMLMMPARNDCPTGWTEEYHGYLMTEYYGHKKQRDFICVDEDAESIPGSQANKNGALLYVVEGVCGNLPCGPYVNSRELTCAVCTKWKKECFFFLIWVSRVKMWFLIWTVLIWKPSLENVNT